MGIGDRVWVLGIRQWGRIVRKSELGNWVLVDLPGPGSPSWFMSSFVRSDQGK